MRCWTCRLAVVLLVTLATGVALAGAEAEMPADNARALQQAVPAQPVTPPDVAGRYEGTATAPDGPLPLVVMLVVENGVIRGTSTAGQMVVAITGGSIVNGKVNLTLDMGGAPGMITGTYADGRITGEWIMGDTSGTLQVTKVAAPPADAAAVPAAVAATDPVTGEWDAAIDFGGNAMPFLLTVKLEGTLVSGTASSDRGAMPIQGTFEKNILTIGIPMPNGGAFLMSGTVEAGRVSGTYTVGDGAFTGNWSAVKRPVK